MKKLRIVLLVSLVLALATVFIALHYRRNPGRTGQDAYLPIRSLTPIEAAVLLVNEENRDSESFIRTAVEEIDGHWVTILTTDYVIEIPEGRTRVSEQIETITFRGKNYALINNSWEEYCCRYRLNKSELEEILGKPIKVTPAADIDNSRLQGKNVSFSSDKITFYVIVEVAVITLILLALFYLFTKVHFLLWIPGLFAIEILLFFGVMIYSPALYDADWFHQRIILEAIILNAPVFNISLPLALYIIGLSLFFYVVWRLGKVLIKKGVIRFRRYLGLIGGIIGAVIITFLIIAYRQYQSSSTEATKLIVSVRSVLTPKVARNLQADPELGVSGNYVNFFKEKVLRTETMDLIRKILSRRTEGYYVLRILIPYEDRYLFLWGNDHFNYADLRKIDGIIDYEFIQPAVLSKESYRTPFWRYILNILKLKSTLNSYIAIEVIVDKQAAIQSVIIVSHEM